MVGDDRRTRVSWGASLRVRDLQRREVHPIQERKTHTQGKARRQLPPSSATSVFCWTCWSEC